MVCGAEGQRSLCEASQSERPGVASDGKGRYSCLELMGSDLKVSQCCRGNRESAPRGTSQ